MKVTKTVKRHWLLLVAGTALAVAALAAYAPGVSAHTTGYWHYDGYRIGTQWCTFLTSPKGNQTLMWCQGSM